MFIMLDGIDGSGKSTIMETWRQYLTGQGNTIFDLKKYWLKNNAYPRFDELKSYDFIFSGEPTYAGVGQVIREELAKTGNDYPPRAIAEAFALDRLILYKKIIIPARAEKKIIIQDRGISTSLCYQPLASAELTVEVLGALPGNALALANPPDQLIILEADPKPAAVRLAARTEKQDRAIFEQLDFQIRAAARFASPEFKALFSARGTKLNYLPSGEKIDTMQREATRLLTELLSKN